MDKYPFSRGFDPESDEKLWISPVLGRKWSLMTVVTEFDGLMALQILIAVLLPAVVGFVTTRVTDPKWKSLLLLALTGVSSVAGELAKSLQAHTEFRVFDVLMVAAGSYVLSMAIHLGVMNPTGLKDKLASVGVTADPRLAELRDMGWQGPLPTTHDLDAQMVAHPLDPDADLVTPDQAEDIMADAAAQSGRRSLLAGLPEADAPKHRAGE